MPKLPRISGTELIAALQRAGFVIIRQRGSHVSLRKDTYRTVVPLHDELAVGTLSDILKQSGISREELIILLHR